MRSNTHPEFEQQGVPLSGCSRASVDLLSDTIFSERTGGDKITWQLAFAAKLFTATTSADQ
jgi:hypothetical protein